MAAAIDARDPCTSNHSRNVAGYAVTIGNALHLPTREMQRLRSAALIHDIGKIGIPDSVINKPGPPNEAEWKMIQKHPELGSVIVSHMPDLSPCVPIIRHHHEWYDGSGYPDGLESNEIPYESRIIAVAEAYDAMINPRSYHQPLLPEEAVEELRRCSGTQFDPVIIAAFLPSLV
jgi:HD-GYP domain-containing protein (c-di-GMP phosphodiesterase class II)